MGTDGVGIPDTDREVLRRIASDFLADLEERCVGIAIVLREEVPDYASVPVDELLAPIVAIVDGAFAALPELHVDAGGMAPLASLARRRAEQGFPPEALTLSIQVAARHLLGAVGTEMSSTVTMETVLAVRDFGWRFAIDAAAVVAAINRDVAIDIGVRDSVRRADFLRGVLHGTLGPDRIATEARIFGLDTAARYHPLRARTSSARDEERLTGVIRRTCATVRHKPIVAVVGRDVVALAPQPPTLAAADAATVAMGNAVTLDQLAPQWTAASLVLETALRFERRGVLTLADLGPLPLATMGSELDSVVGAERFAELDRQDNHLDIERTVWNLLENDNDVDRTAAQLFVHRNTVRYRARRFRELTGLDTRTTHGLVMTWWALSRRPGVID